MPHGAARWRERLSTACWVLLAGAAGFVAFGRPFLGAADKPVGSDVKIPLFERWPANQKPDAVLVVSGQMHGYLQKCGCSDPQKGGLERRFNFLKDLKAKGWDVLPVDLGDLPLRDHPHHAQIPEQTLLKYKTAMQSLKAMGYKAVGIGEEEAKIGLMKALAEFSLQPGNESPKPISLNIDGKAQAFPDGKGGSLIGDYEVVPVGKKKVGVTSFMGKNLIPQVLRQDPSLTFLPNNQAALTDALAAMKKKGADFNLLLLHDSSDPLVPPPAPTNVELAELVAKHMPGAFDVIVCKADDPEPPTVPKMVGKTMIVQVGHKGQNVGVIGIFNGQLHYQVATMLPEYETPAGKDAENPILAELEKYSKEVMKQGLLAKFPKKMHALQITNKQAAFTGSQACQQCHPQQWAVYSTVPATGRAHSIAYTALEKNATRPSLRNHDPDCIICHTVGFEYQTGYIDAAKTPLLKNVGCENCHGPGSLHVAEETAIAAGKQVKRQWLEPLSPWKVNGQGSLPSPEKLKRLADGEAPEKVLTPLEFRVMTNVDITCFKCHDTDNDPHYKFEKYMPKIWHTFPKGAPAPPKK